MSLASGLSLCTGVFCLLPHTLSVRLPLVCWLFSFCLPIFGGSVPNLLWFKSVQEALGRQPTLTLSLLSYETWLLLFSLLSLLLLSCFGGKYPSSMITLFLPPSYSLPTSFSALLATLLNLLWPSLQSPSIPLSAALRPGS